MVGQHGWGCGLVQGYELPGGAKLAKQTVAKPVLVASGKLTFAGAGSGMVKLTLTAQGKRLLKHAKRMRLEARGRFVANDQPPVSAVSGFVIGR